MMIEIEKITFGFEKLSLFSDLSFVFEQNKFYSIIGPSGCGKTTLLNLISGLLTPSKGHISFAKEDVVKSYMMQSDVLLPWRTVEENIALIFEILKSDVSKEEIYLFLKKFELFDFADYYPDKLSAGMKQRIALIQSLIAKPDILLMDEPFSNFDFDIKIKIQQGIIDFFEDKNTTTIMVTHDIEDAIVLSDYIIVLSEKPVRIKKVIPIQFGTDKKNPVELRKAHKLRDYFVEIWEELKYLK
jgi:NitT/TauT family transport system ATP-binding protein